MIERLDISGVNSELWPNIEQHIHRKIGHLDRLLPKQTKESVHVRVILSEIKAGRKLAACEVILELPHHTILAKEAAVNMFAAVDLVEDKLARQIRKYKTAHFQKSDRRLLRRLMGRARRSK